MAGDWYPDSLANRAAWHANFSTQAAATGTTHGLTSAQVTQIGTDAGEVSSALGYRETVRAFPQSWTEDETMLLAGPLGSAMPPVPTPPAAYAPTTTVPSIQARTRQYVGIIRAHPSYTAEIGELYGIIAARSRPPGTPTVKATALTDSKMRLAVGKARYDVVAIDSRRGGGAWEQIGISMTREYIDSRPPLVAGAPEIREYRCQGMQNNARVGGNSEIQSAVTVP
jgi:hypothetical protein